MSFKFARLCFNGKIHIFLHFNPLWPNSPQLVRVLFCTDLQLPCRGLCYKTHYVVIYGKVSVNVIKLYYDVKLWKNECIICTLKINEFLDLNLRLYHLYLINLLLNRFKTRLYNRCRPMKSD